MIIFYSAPSAAGADHALFSVGAQFQPELLRQMRR